MGSVVGLFFDFRSLSASLYAEYFYVQYWQIRFSIKASGKEVSRQLLVIPYSAFGLMGPILPLWFMKNAYIDSLVARGKDQKLYCRGSFAHTSTAMLVICGLAVLVASIVGIGLGARLYQKHFQPTLHQTNGEVDVTRLSLDPRCKLFVTFFASVTLMISLTWTKELIVISFLFILFLLSGFWRKGLLFFGLFLLLSFGRRFLQGKTIQ